MKWTNESNLPEMLCSAIRNDTYEKVGDMSVTELIAPPQIRQLKKRHETTEDVSDHIFRLMGSAIHEVIARADTTNALSEERLTVEVGSITLSGKPDLYVDGNLYDYKVTSLYAVKEVKPEWEAQLNIYRWMLWRHGFEVKNLYILAILRDWSKRKAGRNDCPTKQVVVLPVKMWSFIDIARYITDRINLHKQAETLSDGALPPCTDEERWHKPDTWAVIKKGNKTAKRVLPSKGEAETYLTNLKDGGRFGIVFRPGEDIRCQDYCVVCEFCQQYNGGNGK